MRQIHGEQPPDTRNDTTQAELGTTEFEDIEVRPARSTSPTAHGLDLEAKLPGKRQADDSARGPRVDQDAHRSMIESTGGLEVAHTVPPERHLSEMLHLEKLGK
jgi:hypothetical protein